MGRAFQLDKAGKVVSVEKTLEADVVSDVKNFLSRRGWRPVRMARAMIPGSNGVFASGEPGQTDWQYIYYLKSKTCPALTLTLWVEVKGPNDKRKCRCLQIVGTRKRCTPCDQDNWQGTERKRGAVVWKVSDYTWFCELYERTFGWLHSGDGARGQLSLLGGL